MKIHLEPEVVLIWRPSFVKEGVERLMSRYGLELEDWRRDPLDGDGDGIPELYGRMCYSSFGDLQGRVGATAYHQNILSSGHGSVLETVTWGFAVFGASRAYLAQQTRHRAGFAYAAESTHFEKFSEGGGKGTIEPAICVAGLDQNDVELVKASCERAITDYERLWDSIRAALPAGVKVKKIVSGAARCLLPTALECRLGFTANGRSLRHLCQLRGTEANTLEIRLVAVQVAKIMLKESPAVFQDFSIGVGDDGHPIVVSTFQKV